MKKLRLHGFNNLTKSLSFNIYDICYAKKTQHKQEYIQYIDEVYNAKRLTNILKEVCDIIGAHVLNIAYQDYEPQGASVTLLIAEEPIQDVNLPGSQTVVGHLDKSHITVHTYPESHPDDGISTFRADIDVSTCGVISPLKALNHLIHSFDSDIVTADYRVRGFTRDITGHKLFMDHAMGSIQHYFAEDILQAYRMIDVNVYQENLFHTKMLLKEFDLNNYLFGTGIEELTEVEAKAIKERLHHEMLEIFYGRNMQALPEQN